MNGANRTRVVAEILGSSLHKSSEDERWNALLDRKSTQLDSIDDSIAALFSRDMEDEERTRLLAGMVGMALYQGAELRDWCTLIEKRAFELETMGSAFETMYTVKEVSPGVQATVAGGDLPSQPAPVDLASYTVEDLVEASNPHVLALVRQSALTDSVDAYLDVASRTVRNDPAFTRIVEEHSVKALTESIAAGQSIGGGAVPFSDFETLLANSRMTQADLAAARDKIHGLYKLEAIKGVLRLTLDSALCSEGLEYVHVHLATDALAGTNLSDLNSLVERGLHEEISADDSELWRVREQLDASLARNAVFFMRGTEHRNPSQPLEKIILNKEYAEATRGKELITLPLIVAGEEIGVFQGVLKSENYMHLVEPLKGLLRTFDTHYQRLGEAHHSMVNLSRGEGEEGLGMNLEEDSEPGESLREYCAGGLSKLAAGRTAHMTFKGIKYDVLIDTFGAELQKTLKRKFAHMETEDYFDTLRDDITIQAGITNRDIISTAALYWTAALAVPEMLTEMTAYGRDLIEKDDVKYITSGAMRPDFSDAHLSVFSHARYASVLLQENARELFGGNAEQPFSREAFHVPRFMNGEYVPDADNPDVQELDLEYGVQQLIPWMQMLHHTSDEQSDPKKISMKEGVSPKHFAYATALVLSYMDDDPDTHRAKNAVMTLKEGDVVNSLANTLEEAILYTLVKMQEVSERKGKLGARFTLADRPMIEAEAERTAYTIVKNTYGGKGLEPRDPTE